MNKVEKGAKVCGGVLAPFVRFVLCVYRRYRTYKTCKYIRSSFAVPYYSLRIYTVLEVSTVALYLLSECIYAYMAYMHA